MQHVLVLGSGMVSGPLVHYLLDRDYSVTLGDINEASAKAIVGNRAGGKALKLDIKDEAAVMSLVSQANLVVSLLPPPFHPVVARFCLDAGTHMLTASYVSEAMQALDEEAKAKDLVFLNEVGLDPGLDHMTIMDVMDKIKQQGYRIISFDSHCGGVPSRQAANNAIRYKFSWNPRGVLGAITRPSKYIDDGAIVEVPGTHKLQHMEIIKVPGVGVFESNPNADAIGYAEKYGLGDARKVRRGTLRYPGWAQFWIFMLRHGLMDDTNAQNFDNEPIPQAMHRLAGLPSDVTLFEFVRREAPEQASVFLEILDTLGLLDKKSTISGEFTAFGIILKQAQELLNYGKNEPDLVVMFHDFIVEKDGSKERWTSTIAREGKPGGTTAMAELVGIPAAITARLILEGKVQNRGVLIPTTKDIYEPVLKELEGRGVTHFTERSPVS